MDNFELGGEELEKVLKDLENINKWLGGNKVTLSGIKKIQRENPQEQEWNIVDVGCGNGAMLREIAQWGKKNNIELKLTGVDANIHAISIAKRLSENYPNIEFKVMDVFSESYRKQNFDIVLCTLTLHHFTDPQIINLLKLFHRQAKYGVLINDLHRSKIAYRLFQVFCRVFIRNEIARKDGLTSILRGFKKSDLERFSAKIPASQAEIKWKWAFRYQWIIQK
ncbi:MAG: methyltransferase domain-containing protein [Salegentibacter sp.]|nr:methyltransferase domain-containing protein [Salegentibacter sp.]MDR9456277.1 methyltransferase domain-containing protein [Salegentibacter sp.]